MKKIIKIVLFLVFLGLVIFVIVKFAYPSYYSAKGTEYVKNGNFEKAEEYYKKSVDLGSSVGMYKLGLLYEYVGQIESSKKYYEMAAENGEKRAYCGLERIYMSEGNMKEADTAKAINRVLNKNCESE